MTPGSVQNLEKSIKKLFNIVDSKLEDKVKAISYCRDILFSSIDKKVTVGKLYRYLENLYYQNNPKILHFANYKFDIKNKNSDNVQEQLRSIAQAYLYTKKKNIKDSKSIEKYLEKVLEVIRIDEETKTNMLLSYKTLNEQKELFIEFLANEFSNKLKSKKWMISYGKELDLNGLSDDAKIGILSELYLLNKGKN